MRFPMPWLCGQLTHFLVHFQFRKDGHSLSLPDRGENGNLSDEEEKVVNYCRKLKFVIFLLCVRG